MAWAGPNTKCPQCENTYTPMFADGSTASSGCPFCNEEAAAKKHREYFEKIDAQSMEERVRHIEEWIYNYKPPRNIEDMKF